MHQSLYSVIIAVLLSILLAFTVTLFGLKSLSDSLNNTLLINAVASILLVTALIVSFKRKQTISVSILPLLLIGVTISIYSTVSPYNTTETVFKLLFCIQLYILLSILSDKLQSYIHLYGAIIAFGIYESIYALTLINNSSLGLFGHFENQIGLGTLMTAILPYALYIISKKELSLKLIGITLSVFFFLIIILTKSRASIIASSISTLAFLIYYYRLQILKLKPVIKISMLASSIILVCASSVYIYKIKENSANGRMLIWSCSADMIKEKPLFGYGVTSFDANYMQYQAVYFEKHPNSEYSMLADNTRHPFNEYLLLIVEYGIIGFMIIAVLSVCFLASGLRFLSVETLPALLSVLSIAVISLFSYPLKYLSTLFLLIFAIYIIQNKCRQLIIPIFYKTALIVLTLLCVCVTAHLIRRNLQFEKRWQAARVENFELSESSNIIQEAVRLRRYEYLYNYGAVLNSTNRFYESIVIMNNVMTCYWDSDVAIIQADNYYRSADYTNALKFALLAHNMCPKRFIPFYYMVKSYYHLGKRETALTLAYKVIGMPIKVNNSDAHKVKYLMREFIKDNSF